MNISQKTARLKETYLKVKDNPQELFEREFFDSFPSDFKEFAATYAYNDGRPGPLYEQSHDHIEVYNNLKLKDDTAYYKKSISIAMGGTWEVDAVDDFLVGLRKNVERDIPLTLYLLRAHPENDIEHFWFFYFDEIHPEDKLSDSILTIKEMDADMFKIISSAHKKAVTQRSEN